MSRWSRYGFAAAVLIAASAMNVAAQEAPRSGIRAAHACGAEARGPLQLCPLQARPEQPLADGPLLHAAAAVQLRPLVSLRPLMSLHDGTGGTRVWEGAVIGLVIGAGAAVLVLSSGGGSGSLCDKDKDDDAMGMRACAGIVAGAGLTGAGLGALIGSRIRKR